MNPRDVNGWYAKLGIGPEATDAEIRRAYRGKVKRLHPDSGGPDADAVAFREVTAAYAVLRDRKRRAEYDRLGATVAQAEEVRRRRTAEEAEKRETRRSGDRPQSEPEPPRPRAAQPATCDRCGRIPAQPRYLELEQVIGAVYKVIHQPIRGVFCRGCADRLAVRASFVTWLLGWWAIPFGPYHAARAILRNLAGGARPGPENARLLARQARAFHAMGRLDIARDLAHQANRLQPDPDLLRLVGGPATAGRRLKDRWQLGGPAFVVQAMPIGIVIALVMVEGSSLGMSLGRTGIAWIEEMRAGAVPVPDRTIGIPAPLPAVAADTRFVMFDDLHVREGPGEDLAAIARVDQGDVVEALGLPERGWLPVRTVDGLSGYLPDSAVTPGQAARSAWCREAVGTRPETGTIVRQRAAGSHNLAVVNRGPTDALVKLREGGDRTLLSVYVRANSKAEIGVVPEGRHTIVYATGTGFSPRCSLFVDEMQAWRFASPVSFGRDAQTTRFARQVALGDDGIAGAPSPLAIERFTFD